MKVPAVVATLSFLICSGARATPVCTTGTLADYIALGSVGCTVGSITFSSFSFSVLNSSGGAVAVSPSQIMVTPQPDAGSELGLNYASAGFSVSAGQSIQYLLSYTANDPPPIIRGFEMDLFDPPVFPGFVDISSDECLGSAFSGGSCPGPSIVQDVNANGITSTPTSVQTFSVVGVLGDQTTITLNAASGGSASFNSVTESAVVLPEPRSAVLLGVGLVGMVIAMRRRAPTRE